MLCRFHRPKRLKLFSARALASPLIPEMGSLLSNETRKTRNCSIFHHTRLKFKFSVIFGINFSASLFWVNISYNFFLRVWDKFFYGLHVWLMRVYTTLPDLRSCTWNIFSNIVCYLAKNVIFINWFIHILSVSYFLLFYLYYWRCLWKKNKYHNDFKLLLFSVEKPEPSYYQIFEN